MGSQHYRCVTQNNPRINYLVSAKESLLGCRIGMVVLKFEKQIVILFIVSDQRLVL